MSRRIAALLPFLCLVLAVPRARAVTVDEVIQLSRAGVSERVIVETLRADGSRFELSAEDLRRLHDAGVTEPVIAAMKATGSEAGDPAVGAPEGPTGSPLDRETRRGLAQRKASDSAGPEASAVARGAPVRLLLRNDDERVRAFVWDEARRYVRFLPAVVPGARALGKGESTEWTVDPGLLVVNWNGEWGHYRVTLLPGATMELRSWGGTANGSPAIRLTVLRDGVLYGATNLKVFYGRPIAVAPRPYGAAG
jgi:hypothetical protein